MNPALLLLLAAELPLGQVIDSVPTAADPKMSYALYLPSGYTPQRFWPVLYCLDPGARGKVPVERFAKAAEAEGFIVVGSNNSRNGPFEPVRAAVDAMLMDTGARFAIDSKRVYAAGHSGGARLALGWGRGGTLAGVVACGAAFGGPDPPRRISFALFAVAGVDDFNYDELYDLSVTLAKSGARQRFQSFAGGHEWLPEAAALDALRFFNGKLPVEPAQPSKEQRRDAERFRETLARLDGASGKGKAKLVEQLHKQASTDSVARRALGGAFVGAMEQARAAMERKDYKGATALLETAILIRPESANVREMLERARREGR